MRVATKLITLTIVVTIIVTLPTVERISPRSNVKPSNVREQTLQSTDGIIYDFAFAADRNLIMVRDGIMVGDGIVVGDRFHPQS